MIVEEEIIVHYKAQHRARYLPPIKFGKISEKKKNGVQEISKRLYNMGKCPGKLVTVEVHSYLMFFPGQSSIYFFICDNKI